MAILGACDEAWWPRPRPGKSHLIGRVQNQFIGREVEVFYVDANLVFTVGYDINGRQDPACFYERRDVFEKVINSYPERQVWTPDSRR
jgi:hypothetical protein